MNARADESTPVSTPTDVPAMLAYERGKVDGYAECFADFRRIVHERGMDFILRSDELDPPGIVNTVTPAERRFLAQARSSTTRARGT